MAGKHCHKVDGPENVGNAANYATMMKINSSGMMMMMKLLIPQEQS